MLKKLLSQFTFQYYGENAKRLTLLEILIILKQNKLDFLIKIFNLILR